MNLQEAYARSQGIVVAQVLGCANDETPVNDRCPDDAYHLETIEVLKAPEPWKDLSGTYLGANGFSRCGQGFSSGESYLLFIDYEGTILVSASGALKGPVPRTRELQAKLTALRDYRDERAPDLSDAWIFSDVGLYCEIRQRVADHEIAFRYAFFEPANQPSYGVAFDDDGNMTITSPTPVQSTMFQGMTRVVDGPDIPPRTLTFSVLIRSHLTTEPGSATITVADRTWHLQSQTTELHRDGRVFSSNTVDLVWGENAQQIFDAMLTPSDIRFLKRGFVSPVTGALEDVAIDSRSTQFSNSSARFVNCVNDDGRRTF